MEAAARPGSPAGASAERAACGARPRRAAAVRRLPGPGLAGLFPVLSVRSSGRVPGRLLPDVVVPIAYAVKGGEHARNLWLYKSAGPGSAAAAAALRALLVVFLRDHGPCAWQAAGMTAPTHLALIPSGRGRPGPHPLRSLAAPYLALPRAGLWLRSRDDQQIRDLDPDRFGAQRLPGARVVLLDDTWTSGASAASATAALKLAGAHSVAVIVLGRHVAAAPAQPGPGAFSPALLPFRPWLCAVHGAAT